MKRQKLNGRRKNNEETKKIDLSRKKRKRIKWINDKAQRRIVSWKSHLETKKTNGTHTKEE